jgi:predicted RNase H-like nuclease (RuvC/YqgF family)
MSRSLTRVALIGVLMCLVGAVTFAQTTTSTLTENKKFEVISVDGNTLVVKLPEGTREISVPDDFKFIVNGQPMTVRELKPGMSGMATITTRTKSTPVTVTEVKNGEVVLAQGGAIYVRMPDGQTKSFTQSDVDKRGVKIVRDGKPAQVSDFHQGDTLTATIITTRAPQTVTDKEVQRRSPRRRRHRLPQQRRRRQRRQRHRALRQLRPRGLRLNQRDRKHERCRRQLDPSR